MLEAMATLILVIVGAVLMIVVLAYGIYITFYPLSKTFEGAIEVMKEHIEGEEGKEVAEKPYVRTSPVQARRVRKAGRSTQKKA
jgi:hypothetical protein